MHVRRGKGYIIHIPKKYCFFVEYFLIKNSFMYGNMLNFTYHLQLNSLNQFAVSHALLKLLNLWIDIQIL